MSKEFGEDMKYSYRSQTAKKAIFYITYRVVATSKEKSAIKKVQAHFIDISRRMDSDIRQVVEFNQGWKDIGFISTCSCADIKNVIKAFEKKISNNDFMEYYSALTGRNTDILLKTGGDNNELISNGKV